MLLPESMYLRIQTRVHELFGDSMAVWKGGFDGLVGNVECFSRFEEEEAIDVWVRGPSGSEEAAWMVLYLVMTAVYAETEGIATEEGVVSFSDLSQYHPNPAVYCKE